ncbi:MAG: hypothetical protein ACRCTS_00865 [Fusobacteriaceae bacterium]
MIRNIKVNLEVVESMNYFWTATKEREKVGENFLVTVAEHSLMKKIYTEEFNGDSVRKCLSAISNREPYHGLKPEMRFWNNNMWMLEDMGIMEMMLSPLKKLNLDSVAEKLPQFSAELIEVAFVPGSIDLYTLDREEKRLIINFFRIWADINTGELTIEDKPIADWIKEKIEELF